jgi:hypothetical protein
MTKIRNFTKKELVIYKQTLFLTEIQKDILVGTLLGDGSMSLKYNKPFYAIKFEQSIKHRNYIEHLFDVFNSFCLSEPKTRIINKRTSNQLDYRESIYFKTFSHNCFIFYFNLFYRIDRVIDKNTGILSLKKKKIVPKNIHQLLTPRAIAYWFMDDGTFKCHNKSKTSKSYVFSTEGFEKHECQRLLDALKLNYNLDAQLHKDKVYWKIYISKKSTDILRTLIEPYIHSDFYYKL